MVLQEPYPRSIIVWYFTEGFNTVDVGNAFVSNPQNADKIAVPEWSSPSLSFLKLMNHILEKRCKDESTGSFLFLL